MSEFATRTIKLKLKVIGEDKIQSWKRIRQISNDSWRAANWIATGQLLNDQLVRRIYARKKIDPKEQAEVEKVEEEFKQFFGTKRQATTERDIKEAFPNLPPCVTNPLNQVVVSSYKKEKPDLLSGNRSLRTYKKGMPMQTTKTAIKFYQEEELICVKWSLSRTEKINFAIFFGKDKANSKLTVKRILKKEIDYKTPAIQLKDRDLFLLLPIQEPLLEVEFDSELSVGVDLGVRVPAYVALSKGLPCRAIGDKDDFLRVRMQMQTRRKRLQRNIKSAHGGKGRQKKIKALDHIKMKERNFVRSYNHYLSKEIVNFAVKNRAGVIKMEMLEGFGKDEKHAFVLRNWSYFELQTMIDYKVKRYGIKTVKIDPYHTSQTCSICGHFEEGQRNGETFLCKSCGESLNSDHNAAVNISQSIKIVTKKEQCDWYKKHPEETNNLLLEN